MKKLFLMILCISAPAYATMMTRSQQRALGILHREIAAVTKGLHKKSISERIAFIHQLENEDGYITELVTRSTKFIEKFPESKSAQSLAYIRDPMQTILSLMNE